MKRLIGFAVAVILAITLSGCSTNPSYKGACRHSCLQAALILIESYPGQVFVATGPTTYDPRLYHCQAVTIRDGAHTWYEIAYGFGHYAIEVPQHHFFKPDRFRHPAEFFQAMARWQE